MRSIAANTPITDSVDCEGVKRCAGEAVARSRHSPNYNSRMSRQFVVFASALLTLIAPIGTAQEVSRAYCGEDGKVRIRYRGGATLTAPTEPKQVGCDHVTVASDSRTVGWSVLVQNCCTSYSIPTTIVVYCKGRRTVISPGQMVWEWRFFKQGKRVAVLSGPVHGRATVAELYDASAGKAVSKWDGKGAAPIWATGWEQEFANRE